jgi:hypothetical protein
MKIAEVGMTRLPRVLKMSGDEFQQSFAVAQLAVNLYELKQATSKDSLDPKTFLVEAWELIQSAREHVSRPQTSGESLKAHGESGGNWSSP